MKVRLLDLCSCAGGAAKGYQDAGFYVVGVDIEPQPHYHGDDFILGDAVEIMRRLLAGEAIQAISGKWYKLKDFDAIHASPPCQAYSVTQRITGNIYPELLEPIRTLLIETGRPYVIENVIGAPLRSPTILNGLMFGLKVVRNRQFETNWFLMAPPEPDNVKVYTNSSRGYSAFRNGATHITVAGNNFDPRDGAEAMGIDWMTRHEMSEAIPPAYTEFIGRQLMQILEAA